jgi:hypothetical protein
MASFCPAVVRGRVMRLTRLDACGVPVIGASTTVVTDGLISVAATDQYEGGDPIRVLNANGDLCIDEPGKAQLAQEDLTITLCQVNFDAINIMTGAPLVLDAAAPTPNTVGFRKRCGNADVRFALEVWSDVSGQACVAGTKQYFYSLWPLLTNAQYGDYTIENGAVNMSITASAFCGSGWGVGPYDPINGALDVAGPLLTAIGATDLYDGQITTIAPPASSCGVQALAA